MSVRVQQLADLEARRPLLAPLNVVPQPLEAQRAQAEAMRPGDDLPAQRVLFGVTEVRLARGLQHLRQIDGVRRLAGDVLLERDRLDLGLQPRENHVILARHPLVFHRVKD